MLQDLILSVGEDKTVRVWDLNKRTSVQVFLYALQSSQLCVY
jgi:WD40 repeat protein